MTMVEQLHNNRWIFLFSVKEECGVLREKNPENAVLVVEGFFGQLEFPYHSRM